jgi:uncharacterized YigZ family protein
VIRNKSIEDNVQRITNEEVYEEKIERSRFIVNLKYITQVEQAKDFITHISKEHKNANHNCWAYVIGKQGDWAHSSDNGEPSGTAGKPILNAINKYDLTNIVVVVTRYFGGVKLGIRGLIDAYGGITERAIELNKRQELVDYHYFKITTSYDYNNILQHKLKQFDLDIISSEFGIDVQVTIKISEHILQDVISMLDDLTNNNKIEYHKEEK